MANYARSLQKLIEEFSKLPGIGPKSAAIVLLFCFGRPLFPVDTHVFRISHRLGFVSPKTSAALQATSLARHTSRLKVSLIRP